MQIKLKVWGDYALFARPEFKVERVSYDVMTPSAARSILQAIYWHHGVHYVIDSVRVLRPIRHIQIRRNEVRSVVNAPTVRKALLGMNTELSLCPARDRSQRSALVLKDVAYIIEAHIEMTSSANPGDTVGKFQAIFERRACRGQCFTRPYLGNREFPAFFELWTETEFPPCPPSLVGTKELGMMFFDMDYQDELATESFIPERLPLFFEAKLVNGILQVPQFRSEVKTK